MGQPLPTAKNPRDVDLHFTRYDKKLEEHEKDDYVGRWLAIDQLVRDDAVFDAKCQLVRDALQTCVKQNRANSGYKCKPLVDQYMTFIQHKNGIRWPPSGPLLEGATDAPAASAEATSQ